MFRSIVIAILGSMILSGQTQINLQSQTRDVDFSAAPSTKPARIVTSLPATCLTGEMSILPNAQPGSNLFICTSANTWTMQAVSTPPSSCKDTGTVNSIICAIPGMQAYTAGTLVYAVPANANTGPATININSLGPKSITMNGSTTLTGGELQPGVVVTLVYNGTSFVTLAFQPWTVSANSLTAVPGRDVYIGPTVTGAVNRSIRAKLAESISVTDFGADPSGVNDSRAAIQSAINYVGSHGGGTVLFPPGQYKLASWVQNPNDSGSAYNLTTYPYSNVTLQGLSNGSATLFQTLAGICQSGCSNQTGMIATDLQPYQAYQLESVNGGFYQANNINQGDTTVTLTSPSGIWANGDIIAVFNSALTGTAPNRTVSGIVPAEYTRVLSYNSGTGAISVEWPFARAMSTNVWVAKVTSITHSNVAVNNLILRGTNILLIQDMFNVRLDNDVLQLDTTLLSSLGIPSGTPEPFSGNVNAVRNWKIANCTFEPYGTAPYPPYLELFERDSMDGIFENNQLSAAFLALGEYTAHIVMRNNRFNLGVVNGLNGAIDRNIILNGQDVLFDSNVVNGLATLSGAAVFFDRAGSSTGGAITVSNNQFYCGASVYCVQINWPDTKVSGNLINGGYYGIAAQFLAAPYNVIANNTIVSTLSSGVGIVATGQAGGTEFQAITGNVLSGNGLGYIGIYMPTESNPITGGSSVVGNTITGYTHAGQIDLTTHPNTRISANTGVADH